VDVLTTDQAEAERTLTVLRAMGDAVEQELGEPLPAPGSRDAIPG